MRILSRLIFVLALLLSAAPALLQPDNAQAAVFDPSNYVELVVELEPDVDPRAYADHFLTQIGVSTIDSAFRSRRLHWVYTVVNGFSIYLTPDEYRKAQRLDLTTDPSIRSLTESTWGQLSTTPITDVEGAMPASPLDPGHEIVPAGIERIGVPDPTRDYSGIDIAVIDTGIDSYHEDLNVVDGFDCTAEAGRAPDYNDYHGHGTHVAGTIAAKANGTGVVGVVPNARLYAVRVLNEQGAGSFASVLCGINYVFEMRDTIEVANMSLGGQGSPTECGGRDPLHNGFCVAAESVIMVVAAGNSSTDAANHVPAGYAEAITVSAFGDYDGQPGRGAIAPQNGCYAMTRDDTLAPFSNNGAVIDIAAPGVCVLSTLPSTLLSMGGFDANYGFASGTSMASPHVAGCIARYLSDNPDQSAYALQQLLTWSDANTEPVQMDSDGYHEPLAFCANIPRYEGAPSDYQAPTEEAA